MRITTSGDKSSYLLGGDGHPPKRKPRLSQATQRRVILCGAGFNRALSRPAAARASSAFCEGSLSLVQTRMISSALLKETSLNSSTSKLASDRAPHGRLLGPLCWELGIAAEDSALSSV